MEDSAQSRFGRLRGAVAMGSQASRFDRIMRMQPPPPASWPVFQRQYAFLVEGSGGLMTCFIVVDAAASKVLASVWHQVGIHIPRGRCVAASSCTRTGRESGVHRRGEYPGAAVGLCVEVFGIQSLCLPCLELVGGPLPLTNTRPDSVREQ
jgi:hypothetical protein